MSISGIAVLLKPPVEKESISLRHQCLYSVSVHIDKVCKISVLTNDGNVHLLFGGHCAEIASCLIQLRIYFITQIRKSRDLRIE